MDAAVKALIEREMIQVLQGDKLAIAGDAVAEMACWERFRVA